MAPCKMRACALRAIFLLAICFSAAATIEITRKTGMHGPGWGEGTKEFTDYKHFIGGGSITKLAFHSSTTTKKSGLSVWYTSDDSTTSVSHGESLFDVYSDEVHEPITKVEAQWVEPRVGKPGYFACFTFSGTHEAFQLGQRVASAKTVTWYAPPGSYLGGVAGMASESQLYMVEFIFVRPLPPVVVTVGAQSPWYTTGITTGAKSFDDNNRAVDFGPITEISANLGGKWGLSGIKFSHDGPYFAYGSPEKLVSSGPIAGRIVRVQGTLVPLSRAGAGYWGHMTFFTADNKKYTFGTPLPTRVVGMRPIEYRAPHGQWIGGIKGWANDKQLLSISFVCFKEERQENLFPA